MIKFLSNSIENLIEFIRESSAIVHYFSLIMLTVSLYKIIVEDCEVAKIILWLIIALISAGIAEGLKSHLPTLLRIVLRRRSAY